MVGSHLSSDLPEVIPEAAAEIVLATSEEARVSLKFGSGFRV